MISLLFQKDKLWDALLLLTVSGEYVVESLSGEKTKKQKTNKQRSLPSVDPN